MRSNLISYPTEHFSKLIYVREILFHRPYEACENSNTDIEELFSLVNQDRFKRDRFKRRICINDRYHLSATDGQLTFILYYPWAKYNVHM